MKKLQVVILLYQYKDTKLKWEIIFELVKIENKPIHKWQVKNHTEMMSGEQRGHING